MGNRSIHIESQPLTDGGSSLTVTDASTGEPLTDLESILIKLERDDVAVADVSYLGGATQTRYVEKIDVVISGEAVDKQ